MTLKTEQEYKNKIAALKAEIEKLKKKETQKIKNTKYGLNWIDVPEAFEEESKDSIPILEEVKEKAIKNDDGKPTHIMIEGDNFHALTCLNYTHAGKIDVIYIDPPYNIGKDFIYKDARFLEEFPDGTPISTEHPLRHSAWLSFMNKRLKLAQKLLNKKGVIFISIDNAESANLKLLCNDIFGEKNFIGTLTWESTTQPINAGSAKFQLQQKVEYILCYAKNKTYKQQFVLNEVSIENKYPHNGKYGKCRFEIIEKSDSGSYKRDTMKFKILGQLPRNGKRWQIGKMTARQLEKDGKIEIIDGIIKKAIYPEDELVDLKFVPFWSHLSSAEFGTAEIAKDELNSIMGKPIGFDTVKPISLMEELLFHYPKESVILDFFAGSGTTLNAIISLNAEDGGCRQCILVQSKDPTFEVQDGKKLPKKECKDAFNAGFDYISDITYERNRRVIQGYTTSKCEKIPGLGNSLKYFRTAFVGKNPAQSATDEDRISLSQKAGSLISLSENTLEEIKTTDFYQIFSDGKKYTAIYFSEDLFEFYDFVKEVESKNSKVSVFIFSWGSPDIFENEFNNLKNITIKAIPKPILEIYKSLNGGL